METVNKYVTAASTAIWGQNGEPNATQITQQHGEEPLSGVQGRGDTTDPYDAGNRDEQPGAPETDGNTAPQEPNLVGSKAKTQTFEEAAVTSDPIATKTATIDPEDASSTAPAASSTAQPISGGSTESNKEKETSDKEQRDSSLSSGGNSGVQRPAHPEASIEALEGPQGPPPKPAEEFEKEAKGKAPVKDDTEKSDKSPSDSKESAPKNNDSPTSSNKSEHSQESGKSSKLAKVKESVKKHLHHSSK
ncbi:Solid-state culture expressed protein (Aos23) [Penicillium brevicompactum]|uniref:Solid-state culture expressed protein (Aos23) n=1 Tax=Penicillium brevicompactum TaxID=5074 RepID=A0A9W9RW92_PENBR|nr:Solid-state culture expressed protein (Aos23) [Penicillium brevicompactum]